MEIGKFNEKYKTDQQKEVNGVEVEIGEGFKIKVARSGNARATKRMQELLADPAIEMKRRAGALSDADWESMTLDVMSNCVLVGWTGLTADGKDVPYSPEKARELLSNRDFMNVVRELAGTQELYRQQAVDKAKESLGNS